MKCEKCNADLQVYDQKDTAKPLRCSDACFENRKSLVARGVGTKQAVTEKVAADLPRPYGHSHKKNG